MLRNTDTSNVLKWIIHLALERKSLLFVSMLFVVLANVCEALIIWGAKLIIDDGILSGNSSMLITSALAVCVIIVFRLASNWAASYSTNKFTRMSILSLKQRLFNHWIRLPYSFFDQHSKSELSSLLLYNTEQVSTVFSTGFINCFQNVGLVAVLGFIVIKMHAIMAVMACVLCPVMVVVIRKGVKKISRKAHEQQKNIGASAHEVHDALCNLDTIKMNSIEGFAANQFNSLCVTIADKERSVFMASETSRLAVQFLSALPIPLILFLIGYNVLTVSVGTLAATLAALVRLKNPLGVISNFRMQIKRSVVLAAPIYAFLQEQKESDHGVAFNDVMIRVVTFNQVQFSYGKTLTEDLSLPFLKMNQGEKIFVVGSSGCGKSTLLKLMTSLYQPDQGFLSLNDKSYGDYSMSSLRKTIGYISQTQKIFSATVAQNIMLDDQDEDRCIKASQLAQIHHDIVRLPDGYQTKIGDGFASMSGGQLQRLMIARMIYHRPKLLLCDEITSALDVQTEMKVVEALLKHFHKDLVVFISHRLELAAMFDRVLMLEDGKIIADGTHHDLILNHQDYQKFYIRKRDETEFAALH